MYGKEAISTTVATVILVGVSIAAVVIIWGVVYNLIQGQSFEVQGSLNCLKDVNVEISSVCYKDKFMELKLKNKGDLILGDYFFVTFFYEDGSTDTVPSPPKSFLEPRQEKTFLIPYNEIPSKLRVTPRVEEQAFLCYENSPEFKSIKKC